LVSDIDVPLPSEVRRERAKFNQVEVAFGCNLIPDVGGH
jgi:hypothetical protein